MLLILKIWNFIGHLLVSHFNHLDKPKDTNINLVVCDVTSSIILVVLSYMAEIYLPITLLKFDTS